jgi:molecular chaperone DnaK
VLRGRDYSVPEISAMLLQEMRVVAEEHLGEPVDRAVVTVPAYFHDGQRQAVKDAGVIAGLDVLRIINEPTAAALAYGFGKGEDVTIAVYDLGGGTFDISIVKITKDGSFEVIATLGDSYLGGEDFDRRIVAWLVKGFEAEHGIDLGQSNVALARLKEAAQKAKCELSTLNEVEVQLPFIWNEGPSGPLHMDYEISREQLEKLTSDLVTRTLSICELAMHTAGVPTSAIDEIILVGGQARMPAIQFAVAEFFGKQPSRSVHPDEVVALGAAIQGAALTEVVSDVDLRDVTAHSLGIMTYGDGFDVLIHANTPVPVEVPADFTTSTDAQEEVKIVVLQGESKQASENELLGQFTFTGLRSAAAGEVDLEVVFKIDDDGIFRVSARDKETGEQHAIEVAASGGLTDVEIQAMREASKSFLAERRADEHRERVKQTTESMLAQLEKLVGEAESLPGSYETAERARQAVRLGRSRLEAGDIDALAADLSALDDLRGELERDLLH